MQYTSIGRSGGDILSAFRGRMTPSELHSMRGAVRCEVAERGSRVRPVGRSSGSPCAGRPSKPPARGRSNRPRTTGGERIMSDVPVGVPPYLATLHPILHDVVAP